MVFPSSLGRGTRDVNFHAPPFLTKPTPSPLHPSMINRNYSLVRDPPKNRERASFQLSPLLNYIRFLANNLLLLFLLSNSYKTISYQNNYENYFFPKNEIPLFASPSPLLLPFPSLILLSSLTMFAGFSNPYFVIFS